MRFHPRTHARGLRWSLALLLVACGEPDTTMDAASMDAAEPSDGGGSRDAGADTVAIDAGPRPDGGLSIPMFAGPARAFVGAQGAGTDATGGRGSTIVHVTTLAASGPGSLAEAVSGSDRFIVFDVCGMIDMAGATLSVRGDNITIAGETSPGGVSIWNTRLLVQDRQNVVIRFLRVREAPPNLDGVLVFHSDRVVIDHCSIAGASDETVSVTGTSEDVTLSFLAIEESHSEPEFHDDSQAHNYGSILGGTVPAFIDVHHSLYIHHGKRCPLVNGMGRVQAVDNVVYNWANSEQRFAIEVLDASQFHLIGNYFLSGADTARRSVADPIRGTYYGDNNYWLDGRDVAHTAAAEFGAMSTAVAAPLFVGAPIDSMGPMRALETIVAQAGALPRDGTSRRMIEELMTRTGSQGVEIASDDNRLACQPLAADGDSDGLPDAWERAAGLDASDASDATALTPSGYTNIEIYTNYLAQQLIAGDPAPWLR